MSKVLLVDDDPGVLFTLKEVLVERGHDVIGATSGPEALERLENVDTVVTDLAMPGMDGLELLRAIRERDALLPVLLLTAHGSERVAVSAIRAGAYDYLTKPFDIDDVAIVIERALEARRLRTDNRRLVAERALGRRVIGTSAAMRRVLEAVERLGPRDVTVLIRGETGTGKELVGSLLHALSKRAARPFVRFNCAAIPGELAEAELFGHARGAFTGAANARSGFFAQADGGTLLLDEVGELPLPIQAKLLRALQEGEIQPVGSGRIEKVDVRILASTNRDLLAATRAGTFREDLYFRLAVVELVVPPLRERREDVAALATEFAGRYGQKFDVPDFRLAPALLAKLAQRDWPGNVRELENTIARLAALSPGGEVASLDGLADAAEPAAIAAEAAADPPAGEAPTDPPLREQVEAFERELIRRTLAAAGGNQSEAARRLGTSRVTLFDKIRRYGLAK